MTDELYLPLHAGQLQLANRIVMAPMARRCAGLIISEGTAPSAFGKVHPAYFWRALRAAYFESRAAF